MILFWFGLLSKKRYHKENATTLLMIISSIQILHKNGKFSESMSQFSLHGLSFQNQGTNFDQILVAFHALVMSVKMKKGPLK